MPMRMRSKLDLIVDKFASSVSGALIITDIGSVSSYTITLIYVEV